MLIFYFLNSNQNSSQNSSQFIDLLFFSMNRASYPITIIKQRSNWPLQLEHPIADSPASSFIGLSFSVLHFGQSTNTS